LREIFENGGDFHAVCESGPAQCPDMVLAREDVAALALDMADMSRAIATALGLQGRPEPMRDIAGITRLGAVLSTPGVRQAVFLVSRSSVSAYVEALGALIARQKGVPFALLLPTARYFSDDLERLAREHGVAILALSDIMTVANNRIAAVSDAQRLLEGLGARRSAAIDPSAKTVAQALICDGASRPVWHDLDGTQCQEILESVQRYSVVADQRASRIWKSGVPAHERVPKSHFQIIRAALTARAHFDPATMGPDLNAAKQIFQRARAEFDSKTGKRSGWRLFQSIQHEDGHTVYAFRPEAGFSFAFLFLPED
jgi:hypothetical protein